MAALPYATTPWQEPWLCFLLLLLLEAVRRVLLLAGRQPAQPS
jgi:hypothetical protein